MKEQPYLMPVKAGTISDKDIAKLEAAGVTVFECEDPTAIKFINPQFSIGGGELLQVALDALNHSPSYGSSGKEQREQFFTKFRAFVAEAWAKK